LIPEGPTIEACALPNGSLNGPVAVWFHGRPILSAECANDLATGEWTQWDLSTPKPYVIGWQSHFKDGRLDGVSQRYRSGQLVQTNVFREGQLVERDGEPVSGNVTQDVPP
jgi:hypothetical protein